MKNIQLSLLFVLITSMLTAQQTPQPNYRAAAKYSPKNLAKLVHSTSVSPHWLKKGNRFWYQYKTSEGSNYYIVDADRKTRKPLFDNVKMAKWLTEITKDPYDAKHLPRFNFKFNAAENTIQFYVTATEEVPVVEAEGSAKKSEDKKKEKKDKKERKKSSRS